MIDFIILGFILWCLIGLVVFLCTIDNIKAWSHLQYVIAFAAMGPIVWVMLLVIGIGALMGWIVFEILPAFWEWAGKINFF